MDRVTCTAPQHWVPPRQETNPFIALRSAPGWTLQLASFLLLAPAQTPSLLPPSHPLLYPKSRRLLPQPLTQPPLENPASKGLGQRCRSSHVCFDRHRSSLQTQQKWLSLLFSSNSAVCVVDTVHCCSETSKKKTKNHLLPGKRIKITSFFSS